MNRVLITGATGFVGRPLCAALVRAGCEVSAATRNPGAFGHVAGVDVRSIAGVGARVDWSATLRDVGVVVHLAARAPRIGEAEDAETLDQYRRVNVEGARKLALDCTAAGVRRLVYVSTAKIHGQSVAHGRTFLEESPADPQDAYARTKWEAEGVLTEVAAGGRLELVVLRPPLVYGPGAKGNFLSLMRLVQKAPFLPFGAVRNRRSMIGIGNLCSAIIQCLAPPEAAGRTYLVADGTDLSTPELVRMIADRLGRRILLLPVPAGLLRGAARLTATLPAITRLTQSFVVDDARFRRELRWTPPYTVLQGIEEAVRWFLAQTGRP
jgi:nucleoside-diphosphate-sugar epimerase